MYKNHYKLNLHPYKNTPDTRLFYSGGERGDILDALVYAIVHGEAIIKVVGEVGTGKTMLCRMLEVNLPRSVEIVYLPNPRLSPDNILHAIALEIGLPIANATGASRLQLLKALQDYLLKKHMENRQVVVFVEEAQGMPLDTLEEIRLLSNLETQRHKLLQIVLFGQPELDRNLAEPHVRQARERITNSFYLSPLRRREIRDYLMFRLRLSGYRGPDIFSPWAIALIASASKGLLRRINTLADKAMLATYAQGSSRVRLNHVWAALRDSDFQGQSRWPQSVMTTILLAGAVSVAAGWAMGGGDPHSLLENGPQSTPPIDRGSLHSGARPIPFPSAPLKADTTDNLGPPDKGLVPIRLAATQRWLSRANPAHFTIQVLLTDADGEKALERFLAQRELRAVLDKLYVYRTTVRGTSRYGVLYGDYASYTEATKTLQGLPEVLRQYQPFLRHFRQVVAKADTNNG